VISNVKLWSYTR